MEFILNKPNKHLVESISTTFGVKQFLSGPAQASGHTKLQIISMFKDTDFFGARNKSTMCVNLFLVEQKKSPCELLIHSTTFITIHFSTKLQLGKASGSTKWMKWHRMTKCPSAEDLEPGRF